MKKIIISSILIGVTCLASTENEITPYKFKDPKNKPLYEIPYSSRFILKRSAIDAPEIVYYLSKPKETSYPIAIICTGSSSQNDIGSVIYFHRYFLQEFIDLGTALLTVEQWGVDGNIIDKKEFMSHYTWSQRLADHKAVIEHLKLNLPIGWNGKLIFLGVSEGGPLVTRLTTDYSEITLATINWSGASDWSWREQLWVYIETAPWWVRLMDRVPQWIPYIAKPNLPKNKYDYDLFMDQIRENPTVNKKFVGMTYEYHADALQYPSPNYEKMRTPFLVVAGAKDNIVQSCSTFVEKAKNAGANITYFRIPDMDHYIRNRPDIIDKSFEWLKQKLNEGRVE